MIKTHKVKIYPNSTMSKVIQELFDYRRYCWNLALETWNSQYEMFLINPKDNKCPNERLVRNELVANKQDWQYGYSARVLQQAVNSLSKAWKNFFNPKMLNHRKPKFKSKKYSKQSFSTDRAKIINGKLRLDKSRGIKKCYDIRMAEKVRFTGTIKLTTIVENADGLYACLMIATEDNQTEIKSNKVVGVDANIKHFDYNDGSVNVLPKSLLKQYQKIKHYQRLLAQKRNENTMNFRSNNYRKVRTKLKRTYQRISNMQKDILDKFTNELVTNYKIICIEDLDINHMKMNRQIAKNLHRSCFGKFKIMIEYKANWHGNECILADRYYPSTQRCSSCGYIKTGNEKMTLSGDNIYHDHHTYRCYECGLVINRDENAVKNLIDYAVRLITE